MKSVKNLLVTTATVACISTTGLLAAPPASAAGCSFKNIIKTVDDYSVTSVNYGATCSQIGARHKYEPLAASQTYWTSWRYSSNRFVNSPTNAEIFAGQGSGVD